MLTPPRRLWPRQGKQRRQRSAVLVFERFVSLFGFPAHNHRAGGQSRCPPRLCCRAHGAALAQTRRFLAQYRRHLQKSLHNPSKEGNQHHMTSHYHQNHTKSNLKQHLETRTRDNNRHGAQQQTKLAAPIVMSALCPSCEAHENVPNNAPDIRLAQLQRRLYRVHVRCQYVPVPNSTGATYTVNTFADNVAQPPAKPCSRM